MLNTAMNTVIDVCMRVYTIFQVHTCLAACTPITHATHMAHIPHMQTWPLHCITQVGYHYLPLIMIRTYTDMPEVAQCTGAV